MRKKKVAIFVDWENVRKGIFEKASEHKKISYNDVDNVIKFFKSFVDLQDEEIYRIFVYLSEPYGGIIDGTDYKKTPSFSYAISFIERLQVKDYIAIRKGKLVYRGLDSQKKPIFIQKQVDMLLGLDIAHVAYKRLADRALILTVDTDIIPAMKTARINGLQVIWGCCPDVQNDPSHDLRKHADFVREVPFNHIFTLS